MAWIELHQSLPQHPKLIRIAARLGVDRFKAMGHLATLWLWALEYAQDGNLQGFGAVEIATAAGWTEDAEAFLSALREGRWMDKNRLHDWMDYAGRLVEKRAENKIRQKRFRDRIRMPIYNRDGGLCGYCGKPVPVDQFYVDHLLPVEFGGTNDSSNLVTACNSCNIKKGNRTPEQAGLTLIESVRNALRRGATVPNRTVPNHKLPLTPSGGAQLEFEKARKAWPGTRRSFAPEWKAFERKSGARSEEVVPLLLPAIARYRSYVEKRAAADKKPPFWQNFKTWIGQEGWTAEYPGEAVDENGKERAMAHYREHGFYPRGTPSDWMGA